MKRVVNGVIVAHHNNDYYIPLIIRSDEHVFAFPGGIAESEETNSIALAREIKEETGLDITGLKSVQIYEQIAEGFKIKTFLILMGDVDKLPAFHPTTPHEVLDVQWKQIGIANFRDNLYKNHGKILDNIVNLLNKDITENIVDILPILEYKEKQDNRIKIKVYDNVLESKIKQFTRTVMRNPQNAFKLYHELKSIVEHMKYEISTTQLNSRNYNLSTIELCKLLNESIYIESKSKQINTLSNLINSIGKRIYGYQSQPSFESKLNDIR